MERVASVHVRGGGRVWALLKQACDTPNGDQDTPCVGVQRDDAILPFAFGGNLDAVHNGFDQQIEQFSLAGDVVVDRRCRRACLDSEAAHRDLLDTDPLCEFKEVLGQVCPVQHPVAKRSRGQLAAHTHLSNSVLNRTDVQIAKPRG